MTYNNKNINSILNMYIPNNKASKHMKGKMTELNREIPKYIIKLGDLTLLSQ